MKLFICCVASLALIHCASTSSDRAPASRAGRPYQEPKVMNRHNTDTESLFQACLKEWPEIYCRNRMGR